MGHLLNNLVGKLERVTRLLLVTGIEAFGCSGLVSETNNPTRLTLYDQLGS